MGWNKSFMQFMDSKKEIIMKKLLLILALIPLFAMGQKEHVVKEYCKATIRYGGAVYIIDSSKGKMKELTDSLGTHFKIKHDCVELFNYMSELGWEFVPYKVESSFETYLFCRNKEEGD